MPRECAVCVHSQRNAIDRAIVNRATNRAIERQYGVSRDSVRRHAAAGHVAQHIAKAEQAAETAFADDLLAQLRALRSKAFNLLSRAEQAGDLKTALAGVREARACVETLMEIQGQIDRRNVTNVIISPEWIHVRSTLVETLAPYPEARFAVAEALVAIEGGESDHAGD